MIEHSIYNIPEYPDNGNHQECFTDLPFRITKGEDRFPYRIKGKEYQYNKSGKDQRWFCELVEGYIGILSPSLEEIFEIKVHKDLNVILEYCRKIYLKSLELERKRIISEINKYNI